MIEDSTYFLIYKGLNEETENAEYEIMPFSEELTYLNHLVGGMIENYKISEYLNQYRIDMWIDDNGKFKDLRPTWALGVNGEVYDVIFGNCVFSKYDEQGYTHGLTIDDINRVFHFISTCSPVVIKDKHGDVVPVLMSDK